jgi:hypothetical protein
MHCGAGRSRTITLTLEVDKELLFSLQAILGARSRPMQAAVLNEFAAAEPAALEMMRNGGGTFVEQMAELAEKGTI